MKIRSCCNTPGTSSKKIDYEIKAVRPAAEPIQCDRRRTFERRFRRRGQYGFGNIFSEVKVEGDAQQAGGSAGKTITETCTECRAMRISGPSAKCSSVITGPYRPNEYRDNISYSPLAAGFHANINQLQGARSEPPPRRSGVAEELA